MPNPKNRVVIDTNLWISFLITKNFSIFDAEVDHTLQFILCEELIDEFLDVANRNKFKRYFSAEDVEQLLLELTRISIFVKVTSEVSICRDPKDNFLLALALDSTATHLITGDKDLLILKQIGTAKILTLTEFISIEKAI
jgi:putative PIN family toxin of toxin-antitoxin system